jgi:hypothetical protein
MTEPITIGIPVLGRPERAASIVESIASSVHMIDLRPLFILSPGDRDEAAAVKATGAESITVRWKPGPGDFARKHNRGIRESASVSEWYFTGADDLVFHRGWAEHALAVAIQSDACVIGTNDLGNARTVRGEHSTHSLVHRDYLECGTIDEEGLIFHEGYDHQFCDDELVQTARYRRTFAHATLAIVEHMHPDWSKGQTDATYAKGKARFHEDRALYQARRQLWGLTR